MLWGLCCVDVVLGGGVVLLDVGEAGCVGTILLVFFLFGPGGVVFCWGASSRVVNAAVILSCTARLCCCASRVAAVLDSTGMLCLPSA